MQNGENEHSSFTSTGHGLANDVPAHHREWNALLLHCRRLFKTALVDRPVQLSLQQEVLEACAVHAIQLVLWLSSKLIRQVRNDKNV